MKCHSSVRPSEKASVGHFAGKLGTPRGGFREMGNPSLFLGPSNFISKGKSVVHVNTLHFSTNSPFQNPRSAPRYLYHARHTLIGL